MSGSANTQGKLEFPTSPQGAGNKPGRSILYSLDTSNGQGAGTDYFHKNNLTSPGGIGAVSAAGNKRLTIDDISTASKQRARLQKGFLDDSKVNKAVARDLMNSKPMYTVQDIQKGNSGVQASPGAGKG